MQFCRILTDLIVLLCVHNERPIIIMSYWASLFFSNNNTISLFPNLHDMNAPTALRWRQIWWVAHTSGYNNLPFIQQTSSIFQHGCYRFEFSGKLYTISHESMGGISIIKPKIGEYFHYSICTSLVTVLSQNKTQRVVCLGVDSKRQYTSCHVSLSLPIMHITQQWASSCMTSTQCVSLSRANRPQAKYRAVSGLSGLQSLSPIKTDSRCVVIW